MLPACRTEGDGFAIPKFTLDPRDVEGFLDELHGFHTAFRECFARREPRDHFFHYMVGQFSDLDRKSIEPMALQVEGGNVRAMQHGLSEAVWDQPSPRHPILWWGINSTLFGKYPLNQLPEPYGAS